MSEAFKNRMRVGADMGDFRCEGCRAAIDVSGLEPTYAERKVFCVRCGHVTAI